MRQNVPQSVEIAALDAPDNARSRPGPASYARSVRAARVPGSRFRFIEFDDGSGFAAMFCFCASSRAVCPSRRCFRSDHEGVRPHGLHRRAVGQEEGRVTPRSFSGHYSRLAASVVRAATMTSPKIEETTQMAAKEVKFSVEARDKMLRGTDILANVVKVTLGPKGATSFSTNRTEPPASARTGSPSPRRSSSMTSSRTWAYRWCARLRARPRTKPATAPPPRPCSPTLFSRKARRIGCRFRRRNLITIKCVDCRICSAL